MSILKTYTELLLELKSAVTITDPEVQKRMRDALNNASGDGKGAAEFLRLYRENVKKVKDKDIPKWYKDKKKEDKHNIWNQEANKPL